MKVGKITAKLRDAVPVCFMVEGDEIIRFKNIEMPEALKELEMRDFGFSIQGDGRIDFNIYFDQGILPESFPAKRERKHRTPKPGAMAAMPQIDEAAGTPGPVMDAEAGQDAATEPMDEADMEPVSKPEAAQEATSEPEVTTEPEAEQVGMMDMAMTADQSAPDAEPMTEIDAAQDAENADAAPAKGKRGRKPRN